MTTTLNRPQIRPLSITNAEIALAAGIEYSKLALTGAIVAGDIVSVGWPQITGTPTTLAGYGITDAAPLVHTHTFASLTSKPTTLAGYGITDAQPLDTELSALAALANAAGVLTNNGAGVLSWAPALSGVVGPGNGGTGTSTVFTAGSVVFAGPSGVYAQDNANLFWDDANNRLGIGTTAPAAQLHLSSSGVVAVTSNVRLGGNIAAGDAGRSIDWYAGPANGGGAANPYARLAGVVNAAANRGELAFYVNDSIGGSAATERVRIDGLGRVGIGMTSPTAVLHLKAGTATANTGPLKFTTGTLLTTLELGAVEFVDAGTAGHLYVTLNVGGVLTRVQIV